MCRHAQTPMQEVANSISMLIPACVVFYYWLHPPHDEFWDEYTGALAYGTLLHLPFSFFYHLLCAFRVFKDPVDCIPRKLDQVSSRPFSTFSPPHYFAPAAPLGADVLGLIHLPPSPSIPSLADSDPCELCNLRIRPLRELHPSGCHHDFERLAYCQTLAPRVSRT